VQDLKESQLPKTSVVITPVKGELESLQSEFVEVRTENYTSRAKLGVRPYGVHLQVSLLFADDAGSSYRRGQPVSLVTWLNREARLRAAQTSMVYALRRIAQENNVDPKELSFGFSELTSP
jgi:hypothetical protein